MKTELAQPRNQQGNYTTTMNTNDNYLQEKWSKKYQQHLTDAELSELDALPENKRKIDEDAEFMAMLDGLDSFVQSLPDDEPEQPEQAIEQPIIATVKTVTRQKQKTARDVAVIPPKRLRRLRLTVRKIQSVVMLERLIQAARETKENDFSTPSICKLLPSTQIDGDNIVKPLKLQDWRDTPKTLRAAMCQIQLARIEKTSNYKLVPFVFVITDSLYQRAKESGNGVAAYVYNRLADSMRTLDRPVSFWLSLECAGRKEHPHVQGAIALLPSELKKARQAFYSINGEMTVKEKSRALRFRSGKRKRTITQRGQLATDLNWASYNNKEPAGFYLRLPRGESMMSASTDLKTGSEQIYNELVNLHRISAA